MNQDWYTCLDDGWATLRRALAPLRGRDLDEIQVQLYKHSFNFANLASAAHLVEEFNRRDDQNTLDYQLSGEIVSHWLADCLRVLDENVRSYSDDTAGLNDQSLKYIRAICSPNRVKLVHEMLERLDGQIPWDTIDAEKDAMRMSIRKFSDDVVAPVAEDIHRNDQMIPPQILDGVRELGCFGFSVPMEYGGLKPGDGEDTTGMVVVTEELSRGSLGAAGSLITRPEIIVRALLEGGTEEQRRRWLPGLAAGEPLCAVSVTEPNTGSDVASVALSARKTEGGWLLNGEKTWCTFAGKAGLILVLARTDRDATPPHRGLSLFVIEKPSTDDHEFTVESPGGGIMSGRAIPTLGYRGMHSFSMHYDDYFVPDDALVGEEGGLNRGFYYTMRGFSGGRLQTAARAVGLMQAAFEAAYVYAGDRLVFNRAIRSYPLTQSKLINMMTAIVTIRRYSYAVATLMDRNEGQLEASLVKLIACRAAESVTREALQIHGGMGYAEETPVSRYFVDARVLSIFEGAEETLALKVVGRALFDEIEKRVLN
ncbi:MAG: acyl-CoA/acyl-ACP dehydrogenase [Gammaproteobacteria bacterium]|nr:acyl-CoA/acyl-ACP dehydrogenase [Gammaproteobacteria bacterium]